MTVRREPEVDEFNLTARDVPNFNRTPRIEKLEEVVGTLMEENKILKARIERLELERDVA